MDQGRMRELELTLFRLLGQDVALEGVLSLDFSRTGQLETLLGTGFRLHFRHLFLVKINVRFLVLLFGFRRDEHGHPLSFQFGHLLYFSVVLQVLCQAEQQNFTLVLVHDGPSLEKNVCL